MNGLAILFDRSVSLKSAEGGGDGLAKARFAHLFAPILDAVAKLYWITLHCESAPFQNAMAGIEAYDRVSKLSVYVEGKPLDDGVQLWRPPTLADLAKHVRNDWQDFLGVKRDRDPKEVTRRFALLDDRSDINSSEWEVAFAAAIEEEIEIAFFANDAGVWEMYAADRRLLDAVLDRCRELGAGVVRVQRGNLSDREQLLSEVYGKS